MNIPRIQIQQGYSKIGIETAKAKIGIEQPKADLNLEQKKGQLQIRRTTGEMNIDQSRAWSALGLGSTEEMTDRIAQHSWESSMQSIAEIAQAGDRMMAIHQGGGVFGDLARQNFMKERVINLFGPASFNNVTFNYIPGTTDIDFEVGGARFDPKVNMPVIEYTPGSIDIYLKQKNFINMSVIGDQIDTTL